MCDALYDLYHAPSKDLWQTVLQTSPRHLQRHVSCARAVQSPLAVALVAPGQGCAGMVCLLCCSCGARRSRLCACCVVVYAARLFSVHLCLVPVRRIEPAGAWL
jgi:hypothetical protein